MVQQQQPPSNLVWSQSVNEKKDELQKLLTLLERKRRKKTHAQQVPVITLDSALQNHDFDSFQAAINKLAQQFANRNVSSLVTKYLYPSIDHVKSFTNGISSATQCEPAVALSWGILLIVIQCCCVFSESIEDILSQLGAIHDLLPWFEKDLEFFPNKSLELALQAIFEGYIDFCIVIIHHLAKNPVLALLGNLVSSSLRRTLKKSREKFKSDIEDFDRVVRFAERNRARQVDSAMVLSQTEQLTILTQHSKNASKASRPKVEFPFQHGMVARYNEFIGRNNELDDLTRWLDRHTEAKPLSLTIHGIGGVGKSETALELAYRCYEAKKFDIVLWVPADPEKETETLRTLSHFGRRLGLFETAEVSDSQVETVLDWLQDQDLRWLIVFDNVEEWKSVSRYWPIKSRKASCIIATSQKVTPWADRQLDLEPLDRDTGADFLLRMMHQTTLLNDKSAREIAGEISDELGGSPLFLTQAQGLISLSESTLEDYRNDIRTSQARGSILDANISSGAWRYGRAVSATHDKILEKLSDGASSLLFMFTFMNPDDISESLLLEVESPALEFCKDKSKYLFFIAELSEARLVRRTSSGGQQHRLRIHRATQAAILQKLNQNSKQRDLHFEKVIELLRENFSEKSDNMKLQIAEAHVWPRITRVLPHLMTAFNYFERSWPTMEGTIFFAQLLSDVAGMDLYDRGRIDETYRINKMVEKILVRVGYDEVSRLMADSLAMIGMCSDFMAISKRQEGLEIRKRGVSIRERCFAQIQYGDVTRDDKIWLHNSYTDLVCSQQQINDFEGARKNLELCFPRYQEWGTEDEIPYEYSKYYNQMAYVLLYEGDSARAVEYAKKGYELVEKATPGAQIAVLYKFDYANILFQHGEQIEAHNMLRELLAICEQDCGKENVRTLEVQLNLGIVCYFLGRYDETKKHIGKALEMNKRDLWPVENVIRGKYYLSQTMKIQDRNDAAAAALEQEAKKGLDRLLQEDPSNMVTEYGTNLPMLYDYLVHWECRLITPRKKQTT